MRAILAAAAVAAAMPAAAQPQPAPPPRPSPFVVATQNPVTANPADVGSIDAIVRALYDVISGPAGQRRDWNRMRSLFTSNARLMPNGPRGLRSGSVEDYITASGELLERDGFFEREISRRTEQYGDIAHIFSTYDSRHTADGEVFARGINSIQLVRSQGRWWVVSIMWQGETPQNPLPPHYLTNSSAGERG